MAVGDSSAERLRRAATPLRGNMTCLGKHGNVGICVFERTFNNRQTGLATSINYPQLSTSSLSTPGLEQADRLRATEGTIYVFRQRQVVLR